MKWKVTTQKETIEVEAQRALIVDGGTLCFVDEREQIVRAFAPGAWIECVQTERGNVGYMR